jgi:mannose-6-phosphate isomerase-like protein (cupin superfamily)
MRIVRSTQTRRTATASAVMTTLASPALGAAANPLWRVEAASGPAGPLHCIDAEQVWTLLEGTATVAVETESADLTAGDTIVIPPDLPRQFTPGPDGFAAVVTGPGTMHAYMPGAADAKNPLPWAA